MLGSLDQKRDEESVAQFGLSLNVKSTSSQRIIERNYQSDKAASRKEIWWTHCSQELKSKFPDLNVAAVILFFFSLLKIVEAGKIFETVGFVLTEFQGLYLIYYSHSVGSTRLEKEIFSEKCDNHEFYSFRMLFN